MVLKILITTTSQKYNTSTVLGIIGKIKDKFDLLKGEHYKTVKIDKFEETEVMICKVNSLINGIEGFTYKIKHKESICVSVKGHFEKITEYLVIKRINH